MQETKTRDDWRKEIYADTIRLCKASEYYTLAIPRSPSVKYSFVNPAAIKMLGDCVQHEKCSIIPIAKELFVGVFPKKIVASTTVAVYNADTLDAANILIGIKAKVAVLNMANNIYPGGGVESGHPAQEENIFRRSNLHLHLNRKLYPISMKADKLQMIYSRRVLIFRDNEEKGYTTCKPYYVDVMTTPGLYHPITTDDGELTPEDATILEHKVRMSLLVAASEKCDAVVLGALGCGMWGSPPGPVSRVFQKVLSEFDGVFSIIVFAILVIGDRAENYEAFRKTFEKSLSSCSEIKQH